MGVEVWSEEAEFRIEAAKVPAALKAMKRPELTSIDAAFAAFGIDVDLDSEGGVIELSYDGKVPFDSFDELFRAIAPYVVRGSYIVQSDGEGGRTLWKFDGHRCKKRDVED